MKRPLSSLRLTLALCVATAAHAGQDPPDRIYVNGAVWTADPARPSAEALAVAGDRLVAVAASCRA
jgi:hypothetical protein